MDFVRLFHGGGSIVAEPAILQRHRNLDFGPGFYTAFTYSQAIVYAEKVRARNHFKDSYINIYEIPPLRDLKKCLSILEFTAPNKAWLNFVTQNRYGDFSVGKHDIIFGPVANDDVYETLIFYEKKKYSARQTLRLLKVEQLYNQMVFATEIAFSFIHFVGAVKISGR
jgi:hypothetical protein